MVNQFGSTTFEQRRRLILAFSAFLLMGTAPSPPPSTSAIVSNLVINPAPSYPECHASTIAEVAPGRLIAAWFGGTKEGNPDVAIWVARFEGGRWLPAEKVADGIQPDGSQQSTWNPVLFQAPGGALHLYYKVAAPRAPWAGFEKVSNDRGKSWSAARKLPDGIIGPVKNKPVVLADGSWLAGSSTEDEPGWLLHFERSEDRGQSWTKIGPIPKGPRDIEAIQPSILVHRDGMLQAMGRTRNGRLFSITSHDSGASWSPLDLSELPNPNSGTDAVTLADGRHLIVYNHSTTGTVRPDKGYRWPLDVAISSDGIKWTHVVTLESEPRGSGYAYPAVIQSSDGRVHITYTWTRKQIRHVVIDPQRLG